MNDFSFGKFMFWLIAFSGVCCAIFLSFLGSGYAGDHPPARPAREAARDSAQMRWQACYEANEYIKARLKAPATAEFPNCYRQDDLVNTRAVADKPGGYAVTTYVDAQNSFGANIRSYFMCPVLMPDRNHLNVQCIQTDADHTKTLNIY